ncbi:MAG TPA: helix-turn-helix domain-containing protein, partial [Herpetosiphonaceae bacterium]
MTHNPPPGQAGPPMRSLRERQREERAALILAAAQEVFADKGYHDASIDEIAARVGVAKGTVYLHFASKEELLVALAAQQINAFAAWVDQALGGPGTVRERLEQLLLYVYERIRERRNQALLEMHARLGLTSQVLDRRGELQALLAGAQERIAALVAEGQRRGELDASVPAPVMLATVAALLAPGAYEPLLSGGQIAPAELVAHVSKIL